MEPFRHIQIPERDKHYQVLIHFFNERDLLQNEQKHLEEKRLGYSAWTKGKKERVWTKVVHLKSEKRDRATGFSEIPLMLFRLHEKPEISDIMFFLLHVRLNVSGVQKDRSIRVQTNLLNILRCLYLLSYSEGYSEVLRGVREK